VSESIAWEDVQIGDVIVLKGVSYKVTAESRVLDTVTVQPASGGKLFTNQRPNGMVTRLSSQFQQDVAEGVLVTRLGAEVTGRQRPDGLWTTPEDFPEPASMLAHLLVFHGAAGWEAVPTESIVELRKAHALGHKPDAKRAGSEYIPHVHDPLFMGSKVNG
jgi:hypothetical protein